MFACVKHPSPKFDVRSPVVIIDCHVDMTSVFRRGDANFLLRLYGKTKHPAEELDFRMFLCISLNPFSTYKGRAKSSEPRHLERVERPLARGGAELVLLSL